MPGFDKEIKAARKIADGWLTQSEEAEAFFTNLKKEQVKWEKDSVKVIEDLVKAKDPEAQDRIEDSRKWLADYKGLAEQRFKEHTEFVRGEPRGGVVTICKKLKLKDGSDAFNEVSQALTKTLMTHTKQFKSTETAWTKDLKPRIELLESKLDTLEKLSSGAEREMGAYGKQIARDTKAYKAAMDKAIQNLKPNAAEMAIAGITKDPAAYLAGSEKARRDQYTMCCDRTTLIPKLLALSEKNHNRILKSVPQEVRDKIMFKRALKTLEVVKDNTEKELNAALGVFKTAKATFEQNYPNIG